MNSLDQVWAETQSILRPQMTRATYDTIIAGSKMVHAAGVYRILAPTDMAKDWQENRLRDTITRALASALGQPANQIAVEFGIIGQKNGHARPAPQPAPSPSLPLAPDPWPPTSLTPGQIVAQADYIRGFLEGDKENKPAGYSQVPHHTSFFHLPLLGPAFGLYKILESGDRRSLKSIAPNFWSPPVRYSFEQLAKKMNKTHHRYASGDTYECHLSHKARLKGQPLAGPEDCCYSPGYEWLRHTPHPKGGCKCEHWVVGQLEVLCQVGLARVEIQRGYKPAIQIWRMPPVITPAEYRQLTPELQSDFDSWLADYMHLFNIPNRDFWLSITEPHLAPLMPGYANHQIMHNWFEQYRKRRRFFEQAIRNPHFRGDAEELL